MLASKKFITIGLNPTTAKLKKNRSIWRTRENKIAFLTLRPSVVSTTLDLFGYREKKSLLSYRHILI
jgi:hypothetical protein